MSIQLTTGILQQIKNRGSAISPYLLDTYPNAAFAYSTLRLGGVVNNALRASETGLTEQNISLGATEINNAELTTFANGALATGANWIDQSGNFVNLPQATKSIQPNVTDSSGNSLGFIDTTSDYSAGAKYFVSAHTPRPATNADYIISFVFKNNTSTTTDASVLCVKNSDTDLFGFNIRRSGGNYMVDAIRNATLNPTIQFTITRALSDWVLLTFTVIGGVVTCYADGVVQSTVTGSAVDVRGGAGVFTTIRQVAPTTQLRLLHMKTAIMYSGADLSAFDITGFNTKMKEIHGIS